ncbi:LON peptidase substrate-binding domain-containing protein, partial [Roseinatronobacter monicus]
ARLPLHIFEPRYLAMIEDCMKTPQRLLGMIQSRDLPGSEEKTLHSIGCAGRLTAFSETEDGRYLITLTGISRFRVRKEITGFAPYRRTEADWADFTRDQGHEEKDPGLDRDRFFDLLQRFFTMHQLSTDWSSLKDAEDELLINSLSMLCPFEPDDKQALLEAPSLETRRETLVMLMEFGLHGGDDEMVQ